VSGKEFFRKASPENNHDISQFYEISEDIVIEI
jgi:hypothetical protein